MQAITNNKKINLSEEYMRMVCAASAEAKKPINEIHIYIPRVEIHHTEEYIRKTLADNMVIDRIEFTTRQNERGQKYNGAVIIVTQWLSLYESASSPEYNEIFQSLAAGREYKYNHNARYHWVLTRYIIKTEAKVEPTEEEEEQIKENTHVYIVRAENHHNEEYIRKAFCDIAIISQMTFVPKKNEKGQTYNGVVLLIREWINKTSGMLEALNESKEYRYNHSPKYHWLMTRHLIEGPPTTEEEPLIEADVSVKVAEEEPVTEEKQAIEEPVTEEKQAIEEPVTEEKQAVEEPVKFIKDETYKITIDRKYLADKCSWNFAELPETEYIGKLERVPCVCYMAGYGHYEVLKTINNTKDLLDLPKQGTCLLRLLVNKEEKIFILEQTKDGRNGYVIGIEKC
jgi:hypothetical protein